MTTPADLVLDVSQSVEINASVDDAWAAMLRRLTTANSTPDNKPMPMVLEEFPGGRWYRDLGDQQGHLWGFVQVIKAPALLEVHGPLFMSYPATGHVQFRLTQLENAVELSLRHRVLGLIEDDHREGITAGWECFLGGVKEMSE